VVDDEGKVGYASSTVAVYTAPTAAGKAQYGWLGKPGDVSTSWEWDNLIDNGSTDLDGGSIVQYAWDLNNDGTYDKVGGSSQQVFYNDFAAQNVAPNENHTVTLRVTDNEGVTSVQSGIRMPILVKPTANAGGTYSIDVGGSVTLNGSGNDPDGGAITRYQWFINNGSTPVVEGANPSLNYATLTQTLGLAPSETGHQVKLRVTDNDAAITGWWAGEGEDNTAILKIFAPPVAKGKAQYGWLGKPGDVPSGWDWDNLIDNGSFDQDGGAITEYAWDLNNDGTYDKFGGSSLRIYYSDFTAKGILANENNTVTLKVTDNEGATHVLSGIRMPILVNPTADAGPDANVTRSGSILLSATGFDPDGGAITAWQWDLNGDGVYGDATGQNLTFSYDQLIALGVQPGIKNTVSLRVVDNDGTITGGNWQGTASDSMILGMIPSSLRGDTDCNNIVNYTDFITFKSNFGKPGTWFQGDFDLNGTVDFSDFVTLKANFGRSVQGVPEPLTAGFLALGALLAGLRNKKRG